MTPKLCSGLRKINAIVEANPQWWMLEIFDGFGAHLASLDAAQVRRDHKILSLKEEAYPHMPIKCTTEWFPRRTRWKILRVLV